MARRAAVASIPVYGCLNLKGGSGKSSIALALASQLALEGKRVLLIDADPQRTASEWNSVREEAAPFSVVSVDRPVLHRDIGRLSEGYDAVVIDGPPRNADLQRSAIVACTHILIPVQPSGADLWASRGFLDQVEEAKAAGLAHPKVAFVISRRILNTNLGRDFASSLGDFGLPVIAGTTQRVAYAEALGCGQTIHEYAPRGGAALEIAQLLETIRSL